MAPPTSFSYKLSATQQQDLYSLLTDGNFRPVTVPHTRIAIEAENCRVSLYESGKCLVQGKGSADFVTFYLEPLVLKEARLGYEEVHDPQMKEPHIGVDESGKGDYFGPLVVAAAYLNPSLWQKLQDLKVCDSKRITSDKKAMHLGAEIRKLLGHRFVLIRIGPATYNRLYAKIGNVNRLLAWAHARAIENLLERVPDCPRAISDQFGSKQQVERALMKRGRKIELVQMHRAESDLAVAAASILAREAFLRALQDIGKQYDTDILKGASARVRELAVTLVKQHGAAVLPQTVKCHFRTTEQVLQAAEVCHDELTEKLAALSRNSPATPPPAPTA